MCIVSWMKTYGGFIQHIQNPGKADADLSGETLVVVGSRDESATFPYGFFKWWKLDTNTGTFRLL